MYVTSLVYISMPLILKINIVITTQRAGNFLLAMNIEDDTRKRALLLHYIGSSAFDIFETLSETGDEKESRQQWAV